MTRAAPIQDRALLAIAGGDNVTHKIRDRIGAAYRAQAQSVVLQIFRKGWVARTGPIDSRGTYRYHVTERGWDRIMAIGRGEG